MKRNEWTFDYRLGDLLEAARKKRDFHAGRKAWWINRREEVKETIKQSGLSFDESQAEPKFRNSYTRQPTVQIDNEMARDLSECNGKITAHHALLMGYASWCHILGEENPDNKVPTDHDDWMYFFSEPKDVTGEEDE